MTTTAPAGSERTEFTTTDPDLARAFIDRAYGGRMQLRSGDTGSWHLSVSQIETSRFAIGDVRSPAHLRFATEGGDSVIVSVAVEGAVEFESGKTTDRFLRGDVFVANQPGSARTCRTLEARVRGVTLPVALFSTVGAPVGPFRLPSIRPVSTAAAQQWTHTVNFVHDLVADKTCSLDRLVVGRVARLLAATALVVFPNEVHHSDLAAAADATPATVRRAVAHIESYPDSDLSVVDIATAARVSVRAVQLAFRRHLDTTPMAYLRRVRLDRAHRDLLAADPAGSETVTSVAVRWGFAHPGRFAATYRRAYGRSPGETLRGWVS